MHYFTQPFWGCITADRSVGQSVTRRVPADNDSPSQLQVCTACSVQKDHCAGLPAPHHVCRLDSGRLPIVKPQREHPGQRLVDVALPVLHGLP